MLDYLKLVCPYQICPLIFVTEWLCNLIELTTQTRLPDLPEVEEMDAKTKRMEQAFDFIKSQGIDIAPHKAADLLQGNFKTVLDILWNLILHFEIHETDRPSNQRTVRLGKRFLLEWLMTEVPELKINPKSHFSDSFQDGLVIVKLLKKYCSFPARDIGVKSLAVINLAIAMKTAEQQLGIPAGIFSPQDMMNRIADEHSLMIYIALLKRRISQLKSGQITLWRSPNKWVYRGHKGQILSSKQVSPKLPALQEHNDTLHEHGSPMLAEQQQTNEDRHSSQGEQAQNTHVVNGQNVMDEQKTNTESLRVRNDTAMDEVGAPVVNNLDSSHVEQTSNSETFYDKVKLHEIPVIEGKLSVTLSTQETPENDINENNNISSSKAIEENQQNDTLETPVRKDSNDVSASSQGVQEMSVDSSVSNVSQLNQQQRNIVSEFTDKTMDITEVEHKTRGETEHDLQQNNVSVENAHLETSPAAVHILLQDTVAEIPQGVVEDGEKITNNVNVGEHVSTDVQDKSGVSGQTRHDQKVLPGQEIIDQVALQSNTTNEQPYVLMNGHAETDQEMYAHSKIADRSLEKTDKTHGSPNKLHTPPPLKDLAGILAVSLTTPHGLNGDSDMNESLSPSQLQACPSLSPNTLCKLVEQQARSHAALQVLQTQIQSTPYDALTPKLPKESISDALKQNTSYNDYDLSESLKILLQDMKNDPKFTDLGLVHSTPTNTSFSYDNIDSANFEDDDVDLSFNELMNMAREIGYETPALNSPARNCLSPQTVLHNGHSTSPNNGYLSANHAAAPNRHVSSEIIEKTDNQTVMAPPEIETSSASVQTDAVIYYNCNGTGTTMPDPSIFSDTMNANECSNDENIHRTDTGNFSYIIVGNQTGNTSDAIVQTNECLGGFKSFINQTEVPSLSDDDATRTSELVVSSEESSKMENEGDLPTEGVLGESVVSEDVQHDNELVQKSSEISEGAHSTDDVNVNENVDGTVSSSKKPCRRELVFEYDPDSYESGVELPPSSSSTQTTFNSLQAGSLTGCTSKGDIDSKPDQSLRTVSESSSNISLKGSESDELMQYLDNIEQEAHLLKLYVEEARLEILRNLRIRIEEHFDGTPIEEIPQHLQEDWIKMVSDMVEKEVEKLELASRTREADMKIQDMEMIAKMRNELDIVATENFQLQEDVNRLRRLESQNIILRDKVVTLEKQVQSLEDDNDNKEGIKCQLLKKIKHLEEEILGLKSDYQYKLEDTECENEGLMKEYITMEEEHKELLEHFSVLKAELLRCEVLRRDGEKYNMESVSGLSGEVEELRNRLKEAEKSNRALLTAADADRTITKCLEDKIEDLEKTLAHVQSSHSKNLNELFTYQLQLTDAESAVTPHKHEAEELRHQNTFLRVSLEIAEEAKKHLDDRLNMKTKRDNKWDIWEELKLLERKIKEMHKEKKNLDNSFLHFRVEQEELNQSMETFKARGKLSRESSLEHNDSLADKMLLSESSLNASDITPQASPDKRKIDDRTSISSQVDTISKTWDEKINHSSERNTTVSPEQDYTVEAESLLNHVDHLQAEKSAIQRELDELRRS